MPPDQHLQVVWFKGGHAAPQPILTRAVEWMTKQLKGGPLPEASDKPMPDKPEVEKKETPPREEEKKADEKPQANPK